MTVTENPTTTEAPVTAEVPAPEPTGLAGLLGSGDHKAIGRVYIGFALLFGLASLVIAALGRLEALSDGGPFSPEVAFQLFTLSQIGLVFGFLIPLFVGLGLYLVPLQIGSATIAFPRAAALSLWGWLAGVATLITAYALDGGIGGSNGRAMDLSLLAFGMVLASLVLAAVCIATTVLTLRTQGMRMDRVPVFSWTMLAASGVWVLTLPVLAGNLVLIRVDVANSALLFGGAGDQWFQLMWAFALPQIYAAAIPLLGVLGDAVPTLTGRRQPGRGVILAGIGAFGALSIGAWAQPVQLGDIWTEPLFIIVAFAIILPVLACLGGWASTIRAGGAKLSVPLVAGLVGLALLLAGIVAGALFAVEPLELADVALGFAAVPAALVGQAELVMAATIAGVVAALAYWGPKITGGTAPGGAGLLASLLVLAGGLAWGVPAVVLGFSARAEAITDAADALVVISVVGMGLVFLAVLLAVVGLAAGTKRGGAAADAWGTGQTLEWACPSPPPEANLPQSVPVRSAEPLLDGSEESPDRSAEEEV